jgi:hypothetical protein
LKLAIALLSVALLQVSTTCVAQISSNQNLIGTWEYRQAAGKTFDDEGEIINFTEGKGHLKGTYFGLEREGEHGLFYTAVEIKDFKQSNGGQVSFTVPERTLFEKRPKITQEAVVQRLPSAGFTRDELKLEGVLLGEKLILHCRSEGQSCPEEVMIFKKGKWSLR